MLIYKHTNKINNLSYIGKTSKTIDERFYGHISKAKQGSDYKFHKAIIEFGEDNFYSEILEECDELDANKREKFWIKFYDTFNNGYNMNNGGSGWSNIESYEKFKLSINKIQYNNKTVAENRYLKRNETLLNKDINFLKNIGIKSSETQKKNGKNKGFNNPNFNNTKIFVFVFFGEKIDEFIISELKYTKYPKRAVETSLRNNSLIYLHNLIDSKFCGYLFCYENNLSCKLMSLRAKNNYLKLKEKYENR